MTNTVTSPLPLSATTARHGNAPTPQRLQRALLTLWIGAFALLLIAFTAVSQSRYALKTVGEEAAPNIVAAQTIRAQLAGMNSEAANELIGKPGANIDAATAYEKARAEVADNLIAAANRATGGEANRKPMAALAEGLVVYENWIAQARSLHEHGDAAFLAAYRHATRLLHEKLLPAAAALDTANNEALNRAYSAQHGLSLLMPAALAGCGIYLFCGLISHQRFLSRHFRRIVNPALLSATVLTGLFLLFSLSRLLESAHHLQVAKEEAFDSVHVLWQARAAAFDAHGEESRWLLDRPLADNYKKGFFDYSKLVADLPSGQSFDSVATAESQEQSVSGFNGLLSKEFANITFPGEREAAISTLRAFGVYFGIDKKIREAENAGRHDAAVGLCIGIDPGESKWAYDQFDDALKLTLDINQQQLDSHINDGLRDFSGFDLLLPLTALAIAALTYVGLRPQIKEYDV